MTKYQDSSLCGTQTIDALQESIATLSQQHNAERDTFLHQIEELSVTGRERERTKQQELDDIRSKMIEFENSIQDKVMIIDQLESQIKRLESENTLKRPYARSNVSFDSTQVLSQTEPTESLAQHTIQHEASTPENMNVEQENRAQAAVVQDLCLFCNEEPFGFMVRCQKCKHQFHAGCVPKRQKSTRQGGYIFVCDGCSKSPVTVGEQQNKD